MKRAVGSGVLLGLLASPAASQEQAPIPLTSDTPQYCAQLAQQVTDRHSSLPDVVRLLAEGRELCDQGEVRSGIHRLRRALVLLNRKRGKPAPDGHDSALEPLPY